MATGLTDYIQIENWERHMNDYEYDKRFGRK